MENREANVENREANVELKMDKLEQLFVHGW